MEAEISALSLYMLRCLEGKNFAFVSKSVRVSTTSMSGFTIVLEARTISPATDRFIFRHQRIPNPIRMPPEYGPDGPAQLLTTVQ